MLGPTLRTCKDCFFWLADDFLAKSTLSPANSDDRFAFMLVLSNFLTPLQPEQKHVVPWLRDEIFKEAPDKPKTWAISRDLLRMLFVHESVSSSEGLQ